MKEAPVYIPAPGLLFPMSRDRYGFRLPLVFGNQNGRCPYYESGCTFCEIGAGEYGGHRFSFFENMRRLEWFRAHYSEETLRTVKHFLLYNSGSTLNPREMSRKTLAAILDNLLDLANPILISLESRPEFITPDALRFVNQVISRRARIHFSFGLEAFDVQERNYRWGKRIPPDSLDRLYRLLGSSGLSPQPGLDIYFIFGLPSMTIQESLADLTRGIEHCVSLSARHAVPTDFILHPFCPTRKCLALYPEARAPTPGELDLLVDHLQTVAAKVGPQHVFYIGCNDEGLAVGRRPGSSEPSRRVRLFNAGKEL